MKRFVSLSGLEATDDRPLDIRVQTFNPAAVVNGPQVQSNQKRVALIIQLTVDAGSLVALQLEDGKGGWCTFWLFNVGDSFQIDSDFPYCGPISISDVNNLTTVNIMELSLP